MLNLGQFAASIVKRQGDVQYLVGGLLARAVERYSACRRRHVRRTNAVLCQDLLLPLGACKHDALAATFKRVVRGLDITADDDQRAAVRELALLGDAILVFPVHGVRRHISD